MTTEPDVEDIPEGELGVEHDMAMEARIEADAALNAFQQMYVRLDGLADTHDLPGSMVTDIRSVQQDVADLRLAAEQFRKQQMERRQAIRERLRDVEPDATDRDLGY